MANYREAFAQSVPLLFLFRFCGSGPPWFDFSPAVLIIFPGYILTFDAWSGSLLASIPHLVSNSYLPKCFLTHFRAKSSDSGVAPPCPPPVPPEPPTNRIRSSRASHRTFLSWRFSRSCERPRERFLHLAPLSCIYVFWG